jgi:hypothetical protein
MIERLLKILRTAPTYCGECGWWVDGCPHQ